MRRYVTFCCAVSADAAGRSAPVAGSGTSASRGTSTSPPAAPDGGSVRTRLGIQPPPYGGGWIPNRVRTLPPSGAAGGEVEVPRDALVPDPATGALRPAASALTAQQK